MEFMKIHGAGNDFIIINNIKEQLPMEELQKLAKGLCRRRLSIGADGLMAVETPSEQGDFRMLFFNADGSAGEMCGNGARCIARYGYEKQLAGEKQRIETPAGMVEGHRKDKRLYSIKLNRVSEMMLNQKLDIDGKTYTYAYVELGNPGIPHVVVRAEGLAALLPEWNTVTNAIVQGAGKPPFLESLWKLGRAFRYHEVFSKGVNVNFYDRADNGQIVEITYERGVEDFTLACGTGTGSVVAVLTALGESSGADVQIKVPGGQLSIDIEEADDHQEIFLTGPTNIVCEGFFE